MNGRACSSKSSASGRRLNLKCFNIVVFCLIIAGLAFHLVNISAVTVQGFALRELRAEATHLASAKAENEDMVNAIQSYYSLDERVRSLNMVVVSNIEYLSAGHSVVAKR